MAKELKVWHIDRIADDHEAVVNIGTCPTLQYGTGCFEGIRCYKTEKGPAIFRLEDHVNRLLYSFSIFGVEHQYSKDYIKNAIAETIKANQLEEAYIRPVMYLDGTAGVKNIGKCKARLYVRAEYWPPLLGSNPISIKVSSKERISPNALITDAKITGHYVNSFLANKEAQESGYNEALMRDYRMDVAEGSTENIFIFDKGKIYTPKTTSILPGITRDSVIKIAQNLGIIVREEDFRVRDAKRADEAFFTGTAAEIVSIGIIDDTAIGSENEKMYNKMLDHNSAEISEVGVLPEFREEALSFMKEGLITKTLHEKYSDVVHGRDEGYGRWLTYI
jgi:branched-chain amino acid aminotransferase